MLILPGLCFAGGSTLTGVSFTSIPPTPLNDIGDPGFEGFGVGICPKTNVTLATYQISPLNRHDFTWHDNHGNYITDSGSVIVWVPKFYYRIGHVDNPTYALHGLNSIDIKGIYDFEDTGAANAAGYALHRAFIDGGVEKDGFFRDKYTDSSMTWGAGTVAGSVKNGNPISTHADHNPVAGLTACSDNKYYEAVNAPKARDGVDGAVNASSIWFCSSIFIEDALAKLSLAHGQAAVSTANCAWYHATYNYPKGNNNDALKDTDDTTTVFTSDGYSNCGKTGSGATFAKTTHNGQNCGIADLNGNMYRIAIGMTCVATSPAIEAMSQTNPCEITITGHGKVTGDYIQVDSITQADWVGAKDKLWQITKTGDDTFTIGFDASGFGTPYDAGTDPGTVTLGSFYVAKEATAMKDFTSGNSLATDHWGATGVTAMMQEITVPMKSGAAYALRFGNGNTQVFSEATSGDDWLCACMGMPISGDSISTTGTNLFGKDYFYQYIRDQLCVRWGGCWSNGSNAGVWYRHLNYYRTFSDNYVGFAAACYLD